MLYEVLAINPGSTSTKIALYENEAMCWKENIEHPQESLARFSRVQDQYEMRRDLVMSALSLKKTPSSSLSAVVARGGLLPPIKSGAYLVNSVMVDTLRSRPLYEHASNLGAIIANAVAAPLGIPAYIYDAVTVDELEPIARITGLAEMKRVGQGHNLNMRATAIKYAKSVAQPYGSMNVIVVHLGGGITLSLHSGGRMIDMISDDEGPFSPERAGGLPGFQLIEMATSGEYDYQSLMRKVQRQGGLMAHFGTADTRKLFEMAQENEHARLVLEAMAYNIAKNIGKLAVVVCGNVDAILLTGGMSYSKVLTGWIEERVAFIAPVQIFPGENELEALALGALRVLRGEEQARVFE
jgi:butyrate kinase